MSAVHERVQAILSGCFKSKPSNSKPIFHKNLTFGHVLDGGGEVGGGNHSIPTLICLQFAGM